MTKRSSKPVAAAPVVAPVAPAIVKLTFDEHLAAVSTAVLASTETLSEYSERTGREATAIACIERAISAIPCVASTVDGVTVHTFDDNGKSLVRRLSEHTRVAAIMKRCGYDRDASLVAFAKSRFVSLPTAKHDFTKEQTADESRGDGYGRYLLSTAFSNLEIKNPNAPVRTPKPVKPGKHGKPGKVDAPMSNAAPALPDTIDKARIPLCSNVNEAFDVFVAVDRKLDALLRDASAKLTGDLGAAIRAAHEAFHAAMKTAHAIATDPKAARIAKLQAELAALNA